MASASSLVPLEVEAVPAAVPRVGVVARAVRFAGVACALCGLVAWICSEPTTQKAQAVALLQHLPGTVRPAQQFPKPLQPYLPLRTPRAHHPEMVDDSVDPQPSPVDSSAQPVEPPVAPSSLRSVRTPRARLPVMQYPGTPQRKQKVKQPKQKVKGPAPKVAGGAAPEVQFFEGPPSATEMIIPGISILTVVGLIPFAASVARQVWTRYKFSNRRIEVASGFLGKDLVQVTYKEIIDIKWLRRYGGSAGDVVLTLRDGAKLEMRSVPEFDRNLAFIMQQLGDDMQKDVGYPDGPARDFLDKIKSGEEPPLTAPDAESGEIASAAVAQADIS